jgi:hypothetical protein
MIVNGKQNLAAYVSVSCDPSTWGQMTVLKVPTNNVTLGPEQVSNILKTNTTISQNLTLLSGAGSSIIDGNLLTLPIGNSFLYVEPLYVQGTAVAGTFPVLRRVLVVYGDQVGFEPTLSQALQDLADHVTGENLPVGTGGSGSPTPPTGPSSSPTPTTSPTSAPTSGGSSTSPSPGGKVDPRIVRAEKDLKAAVRSGDSAAIATALGRLNQLVGGYLSTASPSAPSSPSGKTSPSHSPKPSG